MVRRWLTGLPRSSYSGAGEMWRGGDGPAKLGRDPSQPGQPATCPDAVRDCDGSLLDASRPAASGVRDAPRHALRSGPVGRSRAVCGSVSARSGAQPVKQRSLYAAGCSIRCIAAMRLPPGSPITVIQPTSGISILPIKITAPNSFARAMVASISSTST